MEPEEIIIIIPGAYSLANYSPWIKNFILTLANLLKIIPATKDHKKVWHNKLKLSKKVIWMRWTRQIDKISIWFAKRKLEKLLKHYKNKKVTLIGVSLSGKIILDMLSENFYKNISKVILVCSINDLTKITFKHPAITNIYSNTDNLAKLAIDFYSPFHGGQKLYGKNVKNIIIPNLNHNDFCTDAQISHGKFRGKTITQIINELL